mmetsp:Transcript_6659/g.14539  ORF Transcript_6659/g.14539 Transcript_6659/m.14539 type:complete len:116 (+) Transcript_6659:823-1170(+)
MPTCLQHGAWRDDHNVTLHAEVLAREGKFLAQQLETVPQAQRLCMKLESFNKHGLELEVFTGIKGLNRDLLKVYSRSKAQPDYSVIQLGHVPRELIQAYGVLERLCAQSSALPHA